MKIDLSKYPPGTKFQLKNEKLAMLVGESPYRKGIYIVEYGDKGGHVDFSSRDGYIIFQDLYIESVIQPDKYLVTYISINNEVCTYIIKDPSILNEEHLIAQLYYCKDIPCSKSPKLVLSWSKIEE